MRNNYQHVFSPITIKGVEFKNRIEVPPMIPSMATPDGMATREMVEFFRSLSRSGAGIVTIGDSAVNFAAYGKNHEAQLDLGRDEVITGLNRAYEGITRYGAVASIELNHGGDNTFVKGRQPYGASALPAGWEEAIAAMEGRLPVAVKEMGQDMIGTVIEDFANAAQRCMRAGFKMIMVHGAHGHLIGQFLSPLTNKRTDRWGGNLERRARFPIAVLEAIRKKCGPELIIEYRCSMDEMTPEGMGPAEIIEYLKMIEDKIDIIHASASMIAIPRLIPFMIQPYYLPHMFNVHYAELLKKHTRLPVTTVGSIMNLDNAEKILSEGWADFIAMARPLIADPELIRKSAHGQQSEIRPCIRCNTCNGQQTQAMSACCAINPIAGRSGDVEFPTEDSIMPARRKKKVVIVGGGPAGMQATLTAVKRGHAVILYEMKDHLGGMLETASALPFKNDFKNYLRWLVAQTEKSGAIIRLNTEVTADIIERENPEALIIAVGATPLIPNIPGVDSANVCWAGDVDTGKAKTGRNVVVVGAGLTGIETALYLKQQGKTVTIFEMLGPETIARDALLINQAYLLTQISDLKIPVLANTVVEAITESGVRTVDNKLNIKEYPADTIVLAAGMRARKDKVNELRHLIAETDVSVIGDCYAPRNIFNATHEGFYSVVEI